MPNSITAIITTLNEEKNIEDVILSVRPICNEILVIDSLSKDKTVEIAEKLGAKVVLQKYLGDGPQKAFGENIAKNDWVLSVDADERLGDVEDAINALDLENSEYDSYGFNRKTYVGNNFIRLWYPDRLVRLYNKNIAKRTMDMGHSYVAYKKVKFLKADLVHYSYSGYKEMISGVEKFASREAEILFNKGKRVNYLSVLTHTCASLFRAFILRKGLFYGIHSWNVSMISGFNTFMKYILLIELQDQEKSLKINS